MYTILHKHFLQYMIKNSSIPINEAISFLNNIADDRSINLQNINLFLSEINVKISAQYFKITVARCELSGEEHVIFINDIRDEISKAQTKYEPIEMKYFHAVLNEIICSDDRKISLIASMNLCANLAGKLSRSQSEEFIDHYIKDGYLKKDNNYLYIGVRCLAEFSSYLGNIYKDYLSPCNLCLELVFFGQVCGKCNVFFHKYCMEKYSKHCGNKCALCKKQSVVNMGEVEEENVDQSESD